MKILSFRLLQMPELYSGGRSGDGDGIFRDLVEEAKQCAGRELLFGLFLAIFCLPRWLGWTSAWIMRNLKGFIQWALELFEANSRLSKNRSRLRFSRLVGCLHIYISYRALSEHNKQSCRYIIKQILCSGKCLVGSRMQNTFSRHIIDAQRTIQCTKFPRGKFQNGKRSPFPALLFII